MQEILHMSWYIKLIGGKIETSFLSPCGLAFSQNFTKEIGVSRVYLMGSGQIGTHLELKLFGCDLNTTCTSGLGSRFFALNKTQNIGQLFFDSGCPKRPIPNLILLFTSTHISKQSLEQENPRF